MSNSCYLKSKGFSKIIPKVYNNFINKAYNRGYEMYNNIVWFTLILSRKLKRYIGGKKLHNFYMNTFLILIKK